MAFFKEPVVRLFLRALVAAGVAFATKFLVVDPSGGHISYQSSALTAALVGGILAFCETFTPLNQLVGLFAGGQQATVVPPADPIEPPGDTTEAPVVVKAKRG